MSELADVLALVSQDEIVTPDSPTYKEVSKTWALQANKQPKLVIIPKTLETLSKVISFINQTDLDIGIRCTGIGSATAKDVLISLAAFKEFSFDREKETITFGAGHNWGEIDKKVEEQAPGYASVSARCTYVGVGGSILHGGQSWLSSEHGLASDPQNLLDAQVVKLDGSVIWASTEPDLMWALRGGGGSFGVVTAFKMRVYKYPNQIFCGQIVYPPDALADVARETAAFAARCDDPKVAMHLYCLDMTAGTYAGKEPKPGLAICPYDANGPEHGRSDKGFKWAFDIPGAIDMTKTTTFREANQQFGRFSVQFEVVLTDQRSDKRSIRQSEHLGSRRHCSHRR
jgi:FAD/FMN-containing dehydrogenase